MEQFRAYAKINLSLFVLDKRDDGFHNIDSVVMPIDIYDQIDLHIDTTNIIECRMNGKIAKDDNTVVKACKLLRQYCEFGAKINIKKRIPFSAGLGGSSTDASLVLRKIGEHFQLPESIIQSIANQIGSDVYFMSKGGSARITSRGEVIYPLPYLPLNLVIIKGRQGISAKQAYLEFAVQNRYGDKNQKTQKNDLLVVAIRSGDYEKVFSYVENDLQFVACNLCEEIAENLQKLRQLNPTSIAMSGSGSAIFATFPTFGEAKRAVKAIKSQGIYAKATRTIPNFLN